MPRVFAAFLVVLSAISCNAQGRISDPEIGGELDFIYEDANGSQEYTGAHISIQGFFPAVQLDERFPNSLQWLAQKSARLVVGLGEREYADPIDDSSRIFQLSGTDFAEVGVGLTATHMTEALDSDDYNTESTSVGVIGNWFPGIVLELDYHTRIDYTALGHLSSESLDWTFSGYLPATRLWWQGSAEFAWGEGVRYENRMQALLLFFITDSVSIGAATTTIVPESGLNTRLGSIDLRLSSEKILVDIEATSDLDNEGGTSFAITIGARY